MYRPIKEERDTEAENNTKRENGDSHGFLMLILFVLFLVILLIILEFITKLPMLLLVSINCILIPFFWTVIRNKWHWMKQEMKLYQEQISSKSNMEISLFLSAGLFGNSLMHTPITSGLGKVIAWASQWSVLLVAFFAIAFVMMMALLGIHQIIAIPIIFPLFQMPEVNISLMAAAFICIYSWMVSSSLSPLNALNILMRSCVHTDGFRVGVIWNGKYFLATFFAAMLYILVLNQL